MSEAAKSPLSLAIDAKFDDAISLSLSENTRPYVSFGKTTLLQGGVEIICLDPVDEDGGLSREGNRHAIIRGALDYPGLALGGGEELVEAMVMVFDKRPGDNRPFSILPHGAITGAGYVILTETGKTYSQDGQVYNDPDNLAQTIGSGVLVMPPSWVSN